MKKCTTDVNEELQQYKTINDALKREINMRSDTCQKLGIEKEELQKQYNKLLEEISFLRGQVQAFQYCIKGR